MPDNLSPNLCWNFNATISLCLIGILLGVILHWYARLRPSKTYIADYVLSCLHLAIYMLCSLLSWGYIDTTYWFGAWKDVGISIVLKPHYIALIHTYSIICATWIILVRPKKLVATALMAMYLALILMTVSNDLFSFFVACELCAISMYGICAIGNAGWNITDKSSKLIHGIIQSNTITNEALLDHKISTDNTGLNKRQVKAGLDYLIYGSIGSGLILLAIGLIIFDCHNFILQAANIQTIGGAILIAGFMIKLSIWPTDWIISRVYKNLPPLTLSLISSIYYAPFYLFLHKLCFDTIINQLQYLFALLIACNILCTNNFYIGRYILYKILPNYPKLKCPTSVYDRSATIELRFKNWLLYYMGYANSLTLICVMLPLNWCLYYLICEALAKFFACLYLAYIQEIPQNNIQIIAQTLSASPTVSYNRHTDTKIFTTIYLLIVMANPITSMFWAKWQMLISLIHYSQYALFFVVIICAAIVPITLWALISSNIFFPESLEYKSKGQNLNLGAKQSSSQLQITQYNQLKCYSSANYLLYATYLYALLCISLQLVYPYFVAL